MKPTRNQALLLLAAALALAAIACTRSAPLGAGENPAMATDLAAQTADAQIQQTLDALLGSATVQSAAAQATATPAAPVATTTLQSAQLTALSASLTAAAASPTPTLQFTATPSNTPGPTSVPCYGARYVYDETYPDGTRVDPGQAMAKTWRLQNVGTCDWPAGQYELYFIGGDRMSGTSPLTITYPVAAGGYANFTVNMVAPMTPGTYHGDWMLRFGTQQVGVGPNFDLPFWIEVIVRGATPAP